MSRNSSILTFSFVATLALVGGLSSQAAVARSRSEPELEYRVKAAYLINFTRYVEWPSGSFSTPTAPIVICMLREDPFGRVLDAAIAGRTSQGRPLEIRRVTSAESAAGCHLVFVTHGTARRQPQLAHSVERRGVLTVGESEEFARSGGVIGLVIVDETVRFVVNAAARDEAGLRISSRMLTLAANVFGEKGSAP